MKKYKLGDLIEVTRGASLSGDFYASSGKYIRLTCGNFDYRNNSFKENTSKDNLFYTGVFRTEFLLEKGDLITPLTEQAIGLLGSTAWIPESGKYIQSQDIAKITCKEDLLDNKFAYYLISSNMVKQQLSAAAQQTKIRHTSPDKIKDCTVWLPSLEKQKQIGQLLFDLDRKIELNRAINHNLTTLDRSSKEKNSENPERLNHNLEAMAKQLYDYWFVQFDFPDENGKPYKSSGGKMVWNEKLKREIPGGWEVTNIGSILDKVFITPRLSTDEYLPSGTYPIIDQATDVYYAGFTEREEAVVNQYPAIVFGDHSCAVKYVNFPFVRGADGTQVILSKDSNIPIEYLYYAMKGVKIGKGYARHFSFLKEQPVIVPSEKEVKDFEDTAQTFFEQITRNRKEILSLTKQRDELLPLLMNGQVSLNYDLAYQTSFFFLNSIVRSIACSCMDFISLVRFISSRNNAFTLFSAV